MRNGLAVGGELRRRQIKAGVYCATCGRERHYITGFGQCPHSIPFWRYLCSELGAPGMVPPVSAGSQSEMDDAMIRRSHGGRGRR